MRVLQIHNPYQFAGGEDHVARAEAQLLAAHGHSVVLYQRSNDELRDVGAVGLVRSAMSSLWSSKSYREVERILQTEKPDVAHFHNIVPLISPAAYHACRHYGVPVVQTLHNYRLLCPNALFFRDGHVCEDCLGCFFPWPGIAHSCYRGSALASATVAAMVAAHKAIRTWSTAVDVYIALTEFAKSKFVRGGLPKHKLAVKPNFVFERTAHHSKAERHNFLCVGRLSQEKGLLTLLRAWQLAAVPATLVIAGSGPLSEMVEATQADHVRFVGHCREEQVAELMSEATCLVFPSLVYEGMPRTILEAFAAGTPVLASSLGAAAEMIRPLETGLHCVPGNANDLAAKIQWAWRHRDTMDEMGRHARAEYIRKYTPEHNYLMLEQIYDAAIYSRAFASSSNLVGANSAGQ